jgi:ComF family protein
MDIQKVYQRLKDIQHFLLPGQCLLCLDTISHDQLLCECCAGELPRNDYGCRRCGKPMPVAVEECGECQKSSPAFDYVHTLYRYQPPVDQLVQQLKYNRKLYLARMFGEKLREASAGWIHETGKPDLIVPVPLHQNRLRKRGFNQSSEIARTMAKFLGVRLEVDAITRSRKTEPQTELPLQRRKQNIRGAFEVDTSLKDLSIVVIDDVITSGHTVNELARVLKRAGASRVGVWGIARA